MSNPLSSGLGRPESKPDLKMDTSSPPVADRDHSIANISGINPVTTKRQVAAMLADLLGVDNLEDDDNFFMLGGHSLLGTQLIMRVYDAFGVDLSLRTVFTQPTVAGISAEIDRLLAH